jgi:hypothetical protein
MNLSSIFCQPLPACIRRLGVFGFYSNTNSTANVKNPGHTHPVRVENFDQIFQDLVDYMFMERTFVAVRPKVEFK